MKQDNKLLEGVKLIKRHNPASIIIGVLALFAIAVPALYFIFPWFQVAYGEVTNASAEFAYTEGYQMVGGLDLVLFTINMQNIPTAFVVHNGWTSAMLRDNLLNYYLVRENLYAAFGWLAISALTALILFIQGFVLLIRGRLSRPGSIVVTAFFYFLANGMLLLDSFRLGWYLQYTQKIACGLSGSSIGSYQYVLLFPIIFGSVAAGIYIIMLILHLAGIRGRYYREDIEFVEVEAPQPFERNDGVTRNTLPKGLKTIGGHAFARNTNLEIATIPDGIDELGIGAFSNCLRLKVVTLPKSVKRIGANCFFNTPRLQRINYAGSKEEWRYITRGSNWLNKSMTTTVLCQDGAISVDPYK